MASDACSLSASAFARCALDFCESSPASALSPRCQAACDSALHFFDAWNSSLASARSSGPSPAGALWECEWEWEWDEAAWAAPLTAAERS